jgi:hypothetical protein
MQLFGLYVVISFSLIFKVLFIILFILLTIYLLYQEFKLIDIENKSIDSKVLLSSGSGSSSVRRTLKDVFLVVVPALLGYRSYLKEKGDNTKVNALLIDIDKKEREIKALESKVEADLLKSSGIMASFDDVLGRFKKVLKLRNENSKILLEVQELKRIKDKHNRHEVLTSEEQVILKRSEDKTNLLAAKETELSREINKLEPDLDKLVEKINKSSIFSIDFDKFISTLSREEMLAFSGLLLNQLVLSYVVTIILILYGDYLIKRFDLENKYPKIAKFIQLRRKLQSYYLKLCFLWIFIGILPQIFVYLYILSDKLSELFF